LSKIIIFFVIVAKSIPKNMAEHNIKGQKGENIASEFLMSKGYEIICKNWRNGKDELDIISMHNGTLVVVEVKTRGTDYFGEPHEFVGKAKQKRMMKATQQYIEKENIQLDVRFDVIAIQFLNNQQKIVHIENAFGVMG
jgi:putative endonuclease